MSNSSQPKNLSEDYLKDILITDTIDLSNVTMNSSTINSIGDITITFDSNTYNNSTYTITSDTIDINSIIDGSNINWTTEWENAFPEWDKVQDMLEHYPGLKIAFENFKVFYEMVKDDYDSKKNQE